ncbi:pyruvate ferredoxin oxidoreductase, partial [Pseudomonas frederiksbergensis]|nr:pyruvate ferredoxin oxidoreductase [Pseudomonas frederiksbergensis]
MDYKYINQLLERYWRCETSLEEEDILRAFFSQADIPADLKRYQPLFAYQREEPKA